MSDISDVVITNSYSTNMSYFAGSRYHNFSGVSRGVIFPIGTVQIFWGNTPILTLYGVNSPHDIKNIIMTQKRLNH